MMPLSYAAPGEESVIRRIGGSPEVKKHLENLGFVVGGNVEVITALNGNVIVKVKDGDMDFDSIPDSVFEEAAQLAAYYSSVRCIYILFKQNHLPRDGYYNICCIFDL